MASVSFVYHRNLETFIVAPQLAFLLLAFLEHLLHDLLLFYQERSHNSVLHTV